MMDHDRILEVGAPEEPPEEPTDKKDENQVEDGAWDGSEAELVADDDAAVYEDPQTGIRLSYTLRREEIYQCLKSTGYIKTTGTRAIIEMAVLAIAAVLFFINWFSEYQTVSLVLGILSILLIGVIWVVPEWGLRRRAGVLASGAEMVMEIYPDEIVLNRGGSHAEIPLDGTASYAQYGNCMVLFHEGKMAILPLRCVEPAVLPEVQAMILAGTTPRE